jgi:hypothetical protein
MLLVFGFQVAELPGRRRSESYAATACRTRPTASQNGRLNAAAKPRPAANPEGAMGGGASPGRQLRQLSQLPL